MPGSKYMSDDSSKSETPISIFRYLWLVHVLLHMPERRKHNRIAFGRPSKIYMILCDVTVVHASRKLSIDIVIMKVPGPSKRHTEIGIQRVSTPESSSTTFDFNMIQPTNNTRSFVSVEANSKREVCDNAELTPAVIDSRLGAEIVAL
ncbi:unnamed protein product [Fusarium graminearum]|nr:unnamed protein product [Fusarium graminearum]